MNETFENTGDVLVALPDGRRVPHSEITRSIASRVRYLASHRGHGGGVRCLCRPEGIPLGVVHRAVPTDTFYLYPLHRGDWQRHVPGCPLRRPPIMGTSRPAPSPAETIPDGLLLNLSLPQYRLLVTPDVEIRGGCGSDAVVGHCTWLLNAELLRCEAGCIELIIG